MPSTSITTQRVETRSGAVRGLLTDEGVRAWRGIPYAAAPVGPLRWAPPQPADRWAGVRDASSFGARAPQVVPAELVPPAGDVETDDDTPFSEDCLYINICAPEYVPENGAPVLVWVHGGGFHFGSGPNIIGDGAAFAREGIVVVTFNYRLGALGFLALGGAHPEAANCGLADQIAALRWVRENIGAFGGDPKRVTVAGVSAGAKSAVNLMVTPGARGLFRGAISQSGGDHVVGSDEATRLAAQLCDILGVGQRGLHTVPAADIVAAQHEIATGPRATWVWRPMSGSTILPLRPTPALANGAAAGVALLAGTTRCEADGYLAADPSGAEHVPDVLGGIFDDGGSAILEQYEETDGERAVNAVMTDERYTAPTLHLLEAHTAHAPTWRYRVDAVDPGPARLLSAWHGADTPLVWDVGLENRSPQTRSLAQEMRDHWTTFIHTGRVGPRWPQYHPETPNTMVFDIESHVESDLSPIMDQWLRRHWQPTSWWPTRGEQGG